MPDENEPETTMSDHEAMTVTHSHPHAAYGSQGGDETHAHEHTHNGDANHGHAHGDHATVRRSPFRNELRSFIMHGNDLTAAAVGQDLVFRIPEALTAAGSDVATPTPTLAAALPVLGVRWGVTHNDPTDPDDPEDRGTWTLLDGTGTGIGTFATFADAVNEIARDFAVDDTAVLPQGWRSEMAYEGVPTGDGRLLEPGSITYRATPLPLMLQTVTADGHDGAILAGAITQTGMVGNTSIGRGTFDATAPGRQFHDVIAARGRFGVSIDVARCEADLVCVSPSTEYEGECDEYEWHFTLAEIMGVTGTPFPAFADAFIEFDTQPVTAAAVEPVITPIVHLDDDRWAQAWTEISEAYTAPDPVTAAAPTRFVHEGLVTAVTAPPRDTLGEAVVHPPAVTTPRARTAAAVATRVEPTFRASWFADPEFDPDDGRMVRQPNGHYACPHTVTADGEVFGHMASWFGRHTGYQHQVVLPPRSRSGYAAFLRTPLALDNGEITRVGLVSMGCGHYNDEAWTVDDVRAHYDGGPGAIASAYINVGEDKFGPWYHGQVLPTLSETDRHRFAACGVSGDWREVWSGKGLDLVALLAGVMVPGFPIAASGALAAMMASAGYAPMELPANLRLPTSETVRMTDGRPTVLIAAGLVAQPMPWERELITMQRQIDILTERLARAENVTASGAVQTLAADGYRAAVGLTD